MPTLKSMTTLARNLQSADRELISELMIRLNDKSHNETCGDNDTLRDLITYVARDNVQDVFAATENWVGANEGR